MRTNSAAGPQVRKMSSKYKVKSKERHIVSILGPKDLSLLGRQEYIVEEITKSNKAAKPKL